MSEQALPQKRLKMRTALMLLKILWLSPYSGMP